MNNWLKFIPRLFPSIRQRLIRRHLHPPTGFPTGLRIKLAQTDSELKAAYHLLYESYLEKGYQSPSAIEQRVIKHFLPATTSTIIALLDSKVVGTLTVVQDADLGLPMDKQFNLESLRNEGRLICEISSLAIDKNYRKQFSILFFMFHYYYIYARQYLGLDTAVMAAHPNQQDFYSALFDFKELPSRVVENYSFVNGAPAAGLYHRFEELNHFLRAESPEWAHFFLDLDFDCHQFPDREIMQGFDPSLHTDHLEDLIKSLPSDFKSLTEEEKERILYNYPTDLLGLKEKVGHRQGEMRFRSISKGFFQIDNLFLEFRLLNLSANGLMIFGDLKAINLDQNYNFFLRHKGRVIRAEVQFIWKDTRRKKAGGRIVGPTRSWLNFVNEYLCLFPNEKLKNHK